MPCTLSTPSTEPPLQLQHLSEKPLVELRRLWKAIVGGEPPQHMRSTTLVKAIAYHHQARLYGDLSTPLRREMLAQAKPMIEPPRLEAAQALLPGTRLLRSWRGVLHEVTVREEGYEWSGDLYPSLSRIAREITGTRWNGPRFFGLRETSADKARTQDG